VPLPPWDWPATAADNALAYESAPLEQDTVMVGTGSVDLWLQADTDDVDVQVTLTEVRPDGNETMVQSGWQSASQRALSDQATLDPPHEHRSGCRAVAERRVERGSGRTLPVRQRLGFASKPSSTRRVSRPRWKFDVLDEPGGTKVRAAGGDHLARRTPDRQRRHRRAGLPALPVVARSALPALTALLTG
jgi:hypothetical protein